jgi:hypothetical protein
MSDDNKNATRRVANLLKFYEDTLQDASDKEVEDELRSLGQDLLKVSEEARFAINGAMDRFYAARAKAQRECLGQDLTLAVWLDTRIDDSDDCEKPPSQDDDNLCRKGDSPTQ